MWEDFAAIASYLRLLEKVVMGNEQLENNIIK